MRAWGALSGRAVFHRLDAPLVSGRFIRLVLVTSDRPAVSRFFPDLPQFSGLPPVPLPLP